MKIELMSLVSTTTFVPIIGERTTELLQRFSQKLDEDEIETLKNEAIEILSSCVPPQANETKYITNLVVGYVQSGKTMSFTVLSALANDNGYRVIIYFAGTKNNLLSQTSKRIKKDLINNGANNQFYKLHENPSMQDVQRIKNELLISTKPLILITVLKNSLYLNQLAEIFKSNDVRNSLKYGGVLIIDDEADQASLNGYAYKNSKASSSQEWEDDEYTATYSSILNLKSSLPNHSYIQYTATPQGPLLISILDLLSPKKHIVLTPGKKYTGGKTFFVDEPGLIITIPDNQVYNSKRNPLTQCPPSLDQAVKLHLMSVAIIVKILKKENYLSMMVHADKDQDASRTFYKWIKELIESWTAMISCDENDLARIELIDSFRDVYPEAIREYQKYSEPFPSFDEIVGQLPDIIFDTDIALIISSNRRGQKEIDWDGGPSHILIGAEMLNRGFTVENLAITYMPRYSLGKSTADTIQQRCRFFGYKKNYLRSCRVFLPVDTILEYTDYVEHEEEMRNWLKENKSLEAVEQLLIISPQLNATRKNILSVDTVSTKLNGWRKMNAFQAIEENITFVENFLAKITFEKYREYGTDDRNHRFAKLPVEEVLLFLLNFKFSNMPDTARKQATLRYIKYLAQKNENPLKHAYLIEMAYKGKPRERAFNEQTMRVNNLHSGKSTTGITTYPGDSEIRFEDSICIQIHKVKLKCESVAWGGIPYAYTLAIYYPEDFAINYVATVGKK